MINKEASPLESIPAIISLMQLHPATMSRVRVDRVMD